MKRIVLCMTALMTIFSACNSASTNNETADTSAVAKENSLALPASPVSVILSNYLKLKNALADDDSKEAADAANSLLIDIQSIDMAAMDEQKHKAYMLVLDDIKENAAHIRDNAEKISHQREHFEMLSKDVYDLVKAFGAGQTLYKDFCPMASEGKGAFWLSEYEDIRNPYLGGQMPKCGEVQEKLK